MMEAVKIQSNTVTTQGNGTKTMAAATPAGTQPVMGMTAEQVKAQVQKLVQDKLQELLASPPSEEIAEPLNWWDIFAFGPVQPGASTVPPAGFTPGPLLPHQVIRKGEEAYVAAVLILNPVGPSVPSALDILSNFALPYEIAYNTGELTKWQPAPASLQHISHGALVPGVAIYVDVFSFVAQDAGLYEMNISARIFGCEGNTAPPFSGFATWVFDLDEDYLADLLGLPGGPGFYHKNPIRFQVYE
jgi:hypothetical protein